MTVQQLNYFAGELTQLELSKVANTKLAYALLKTKGRLFKLLRHHFDQAKLEPSEQKELEELSTQRGKDGQELVRERAKKDEKGEFIYKENSQGGKIYDLSPEDQVEIDKILSEKYPRLDELNEKLSKVRNEILKREIPEEELIQAYWRIPASELPPNLNMEQLARIESLIIDDFEEPNMKKS